MWVAIATTCVTSTLFLTGLAPNLLAMELVKKTAKCRSRMGRLVYGSRTGGNFAACVGAACSLTGSIHRKSKKAPR